ncbi:MAG: AAA family ATPase [Prosthecobacter sp.]
MPSSTTQPIATPLRLKKLVVENYKRLDSLTLEFPTPLLEGDADIFVLGSENGGGKTSVMECIGLLFFCVFAPRPSRVFEDGGWLTDLPDLFIKSGSDACTIHGEFEIGGEIKKITLKIPRGGELKVTGDKDDLIKHWKRHQHWADLSDPDEALMKLLGISGEPLVLPPLIHFNSSRKVQEGSIDLAALTERGDPRARMSMSRTRFGRPVAISTISAFKTEMLASLLGKASLFEGMSANQSKVTSEKLNELLLRYAGGTIDQLRNGKGGSIDFRVRRMNGVR